MPFRVKDGKDNLAVLSWRPMFYTIATVCLLAGCRQVGYQPSQLPTHLAARPTVDVNSLDLSRLATTDFDNEKVFPGDTVNVTVVTGLETKQPVPWEVTVAANGTVNVPLIGAVSVAGRDLRQTQDLIRNASIQRGIYRQPNVSVALAKRQTNRISVMGAVEKPGTYDLPRAGSDLLNAIVSAGGFREDADRVVEVRLPSQTIQTTPSLPASQGKPVAEVARTSYRQPISQTATVPARTVRIDLVAATTTAQPEGYGLLDGSIVMVKKMPPRHIHVMGLVNRSNRFELPPGQNVRLLDAIAMAQGTKISLADRVYIIRQVTGTHEPAVINCSIRGAKKDPNQNLMLTDGDVVSVEETPFTFVIGTLKETVRIGLSSKFTLF